MSREVFICDAVRTPLEARTAAAHGQAGGEE